jgi:hypothetical protein
MTQPDAFLESAKERADEKGMRVDVYLARQIELSALALERVYDERDESREMRVSVAFDAEEITSASRRLKNVLTAESEA